MADMDRVARKLLESKSRNKSKAAAENVAKWKAPISESDPEGLKMMKKDYKAMNQGKALKNADSMAPANKKMMKPTVNADARKSKSMVSGIAETDPFAKLERDLPSSTRGMKMVGEEALEQEGKQVAKKGLGKLGRMGAAGLAGGAIGLGINALMEGLDAEETGSEEEDLDVAAKRQGEKTTAKLKSEKAKMPSMMKSSTKKRVEKVDGLPAKVKETKVFTIKPKSDEDIVKGFNNQLDRNFGPMEMEGWDNVDKVMRDEFKKAAKESNKKPISKYMKR